MGKLALKHEQLISSLDRLGDAVGYLKKFDQFKQPSEFISKKELYRSFRDSLIQRFEFTTDLFWKYLKRYLVEELKQKVEFNAPRPVIREACKAKLLTESDAEVLLEMIDDRNMSSHIYKEEIADQIGVRASRYYTLMNSYIHKLTPQ